MTLVAKNYGFASQKLCFYPRNVVFSENKSCFCVKWLLFFHRTIVLVVLNQSILLRNGMLIFNLLKCQYPLLLIFRYKQANFTFLYPLKGFFLYKDIF